MVYVEVLTVGTCMNRGSVVQKAQMWFLVVHRTPFRTHDPSQDAVTGHRGSDMHQVISASFLALLPRRLSDTRGGSRIARNARPRCRWRQQTWRRCSPSRLPYGVYQASHKAPHSHTLVSGRAGPGVRWALNGNAHGILATRSVPCCSSHMACPCLLSRRLPYNGRCS